MLTIGELRAELERVTYKPGWRFTLYQHRGGEGVWLSIMAELGDAYHPHRTTVINVRSAVPPIPDRSYFHAWLNWRLGRIEQHELCEWYRVDGTPLHNPHAPGANDES